MTVIDPPHASLAISRPLLAWLRQDRIWMERPALWRWRLSWLAALGTLNAGLTERLSGTDTAPLDDPVLVVGPWRSGTTVMHELLSAATGLPTPRTWQCMDPCAFRLTGKRGHDRLVARPMDGLAISSDSPQEDEFALLALGVESSYRAFWMPHRLAELSRTLDPSYWLAHAEWLRPWESFLRGVLATQGGVGATQLILKSPNHSYRIPSILQRFPRSRFVWMARDPTQVFMSNLKMWTSMFETHGITQQGPLELDNFLRLAIGAAAQVLHWCIDHLPADRFVVVPHETLAAQPAATAEAAITCIGLRCAQHKQPLQETISRIAGGRIERYAAAPGTHAAALRALEDAQRAALHSHGLAAAARAR